MDTNSPKSRRPGLRLALRAGAAGFILLLVVVVCFAAWIEMVNGDRYSGNVVSMNRTNVTLRSEAQGPITLPRSQVARNTFGNAEVVGQPLAATNRSSGSVPQTLPALDLALKQQAQTTLSNRVAPIPEDLLAQAGPEANRQYTELLRGLMTGSLSVSDLRTRALQTLQEAEEVKQDLGPEADKMLDGYLQILRAFVDKPSGRSNAP